MNLNNLKKEIDNIKINIGIEEKNLKEKDKKIKKIGIKNIDDCEEFLLKLKNKRKRLLNKSNKLKEKAERILDNV